MPMPLAPQFWFEMVGTVLPAHAFEEAPETARIHSIAGLLGTGQALVERLPFFLRSGTALLPGLPRTEPRLHVKAQW